MPQYEKYSTTVIGAHSVPRWYEAFDRLVALGQLAPGDFADAQLRATQAAILEQEIAGIDVITGGEMHRRTHTQTAIAHSGIGVEVQAGTPKPDISSVEAFRGALLKAKSIGYLKQEGTSGSYLHALFERLGIADVIRSKFIRPETEIVSELVAKGEIELGMVSLHK